MKSLDDKFVESDEFGIIATRSKNDTPQPLKNTRSVRDQPKLVLTGEKIISMI